MISEEDIVWKPIPNTSQEFAIDSRADHTLYHGTRGPGKTITQLMRFRRYVGIGYGQYWRGVIIDKEYKNFADLIAQSKRFFLQFDDGAKFYESPSKLLWKWQTGEELMFRHAKKASDYDNFHGHELPFIGFNELTKHPTSELYDLMGSTNRSSFVPEIHTPKKTDINGNVIYTANGTPIFDTIDGKPLPPIPLQFFSTTNPSGIGHSWVKKRFISCAKNGEVVKKEFKVFNPKTKKEEIVTKTQVAIFGSYKENIFLPPSYIAELDRLTDSDENLKKAWLKGSWDITSGGAIDDLWDPSVHIVDNFTIPKNWYIDRSMDWGSSHPFSVCWWALANGEEVVLKNGSKFCPQRGSLIMINEWYGTEEQGSNKGLRMSAGDVADGIIDREKLMMNNKDILTQPWEGPADNQIRDVRESDVDTIEKKMLDKGIAWEHSDKSSGSRRNGLQLLRDRLLASTRKEGQGIYFMRKCSSAIDTLPILPRDDRNIDDVDTKAEDHIYDAVRYRVLKGADSKATKIKINFPT